MRKERIKNRILEIVLWILGILMMIPFALVILTSLKDTQSAGLFRLTIPDVLHFENYITVWKEGAILQGFKNSVIIAVPMCVFSLFCSSLLSFYLARVKTKFSKFLYIFIVMGMAAPLSIATTFLLLKQLSLINTRMGIILVQTALEIPFTTFIMVGFVEGLPKELDEAATLDGCNAYQMFFHVIMPLLKPVLATTLVLALLDSWNDAQVSLFFLTDSNKWTMPLNVNRFSHRYTSEWNYTFGSVFLTTLPVLIAYLFGQNYIIDGMTAGSVKG